MDMPIRLVIKAPNQRVEDQTVECMLEWTVRKLKRHLETVYPSKPVSEMKTVIKFYYYSFCVPLMYD